MKRSIIIPLHVAYWLVFSFLTISTIIVAGNNFKVNAHISFFLNLFLAASCFYTFYFILVPRFLATRKIKLFLLSALATCVTSAVIIIVIHILIQLHNPPPDVLTQPVSFFPVIVNWIMVVSFHSVIGMVHGLLASFMKGFFIWYDQIHLKELLEKKNVETQMSLIKARINPHFLFNTLNNIDVLIKSDAASASHYLQKLCNIMRFTLYENQSEYITLEQEINIIRQYIELESIRSANKDFISLEVTGSTHKISIAPMLFIPFLENAIKHSGSRKVTDAITVKVEVLQYRTISFVCRNLIGQTNTSSEGGLGIELIKQRLNLLYPNKHELVLQQENDYFEVKLIITSI